MAFIHDHAQLDYAFRSNADISAYQSEYLYTMIIANLMGSESTIHSQPEWLDWIQHWSGQACSETWLHGHEQSSLCILVNGDLALLMYFPDSDGSSFSSLSDSQTDGTLVQFQLSNGQLDVYPKDKLVIRSTALAAMNYFYATGEKDPSMTWEKD